MNREVVLCSLGTEEAVSEHEKAKNETIARMIAEFKGCNFSGEYHEAKSYPHPLYFVPHRTIIGMDIIQRLGIRSADDLYGGAVPYCYLATKAISHGLVGDNAEHPPGWSRAFSEAIKGAVLPGFTAFSVPDCQVAAEILLKDGPVRVKETLAAGGQGQYIIHTVEELESVISEMDHDKIERFGLVLERNLHNMTTYSIGQIEIDRIMISYYGTQRLAVDNHGASCYGGSDLVVARGGYDGLLKIDIPETARLAVLRAATYDCAIRYYPNIIVSRKNYDVVQGPDARGDILTGVLEHSWRIGGASGPEIAAMQAFKDDPTLQVVESSSFERYGEDIEVPAGSFIHFVGIDPVSVPMKIYTVVDRCM